MFRSKRNVHKNRHSEETRNFPRTCAFMIGLWSHPWDSTSPEAFLGSADLAQPRQGYDWDLNAVVRYPLEHICYIRYSWMCVSYVCSGTHLEWNYEKEVGFKKNLVVPTPRSFVKNYLNLQTTKLSPRYLILRYQYCVIRTIFLKSKLTTS